MRINQDHNTIDIEPRDINYILPAYIRSYQFYTKGQDPVKIIFPMQPSVQSSSGAIIPIEYVPMDSPIAVDIVKDGSIVEEVGEVESSKDAEIAKLKAEIASLNSPSIITQPNAPISKAKAALAKAASRQPKGPPDGKVIAPGSPLSDTPANRKEDQAMVRGAMAREADIDEGKQKLYEKKIARGADGKPEVKE